LAIVPLFDYNGTRLHAHGSCSFRITAYGENMTCDLDQLIDRRRSDSVKWNRYEPDVLPLWVADMDFLSPEPVRRALHERVEHGVFGYGHDSHELCQIVAERMQRLYGWRVAVEALMLMPGVVSGFNLAVRALTQPGDGVLIQTPVYPPFLHAPAHAGCVSDEMELTHRPDGSYSVDFELFERAISARTRIFILCNPHNPVGRVFSRQELEAMADICLRNNMAICSDEIHCDLVLPGHQHVPIASLSPEVERQTITLIAPSKTFNIPGLHCSLAVVPDAGLRQRLRDAAAGMVGDVNVLGQVAALAAYRDGQPWLDAVLDYLQTNCDLLSEYLGDHLPSIQMAKPEATYLGWLDCRRLALQGSPYEFFLSQARVALNDGALFGRGGEGYVRLNFACRRATLLEALARMKQAVDAHQTAKKNAGASSA